MLAIGLRMHNCDVRPFEFGGEAESGLELEVGIEMGNRCESRP